MFKIISITAIALALVGCQESATGATCHEVITSETVITQVIDTCMDCTVVTYTYDTTTVCE
jgi:hypothetical protein